MLLKKTALGALVAVALALAALTVRAASDLKPAEAELRKAIETKDFAALDRAIQAIRTVGGEEAARLLVKIAQKIPPGEDLLYWRLLNGAAGMQEEGGLKEIADSILASGGGAQAAFARDLMFALQNNRAKATPQVVHARVLEKGADDLKLMAADQLALIESVESVDVLIGALKREEKKESDLKKRLLNGLKSLTGADCGAAANWEKWWADARKDGPQGRSKRESNTGTVVDEGFRGPETAALEKIGPGEILVLGADVSKHPPGKGACNFDHIEDTIEQMKIPHTVDTIENLNAGKIQLEGRMALIINCVQLNDHCICPTCKASNDPSVNRLHHCEGCDKHENVNHKLTGAPARRDASGEKQKPQPSGSGPAANNVKRIKEWVERGGYLFTEDYGLWLELELAWPNFVKASKSLKHKTVTCSPARGRTTHPMLRGVFVDPNAQIANGPTVEGGSSLREPGEPDVNAKIERQWVIDDDSPLIDVTGGQNVVLLMTSEELKKDGGPTTDAVALTFLPAGPQTEKFAGEGHPEKLQGGRVMHVLSHFGKQQSREDEFALQNLLLNFLLEGHRRFPKGVK